MYLIGFGVDVHNVIEKNNHMQKLGGVAINLNYAIEATSDGDVLLHAISNAILGATGFDDIGTYFPDTKKLETKLDSIEIINFALKKMFDAGHEINNIDITIMCNLIWFSKIKESISNNLKTILKCPRVSLKATRWEKESNQIKCYASVLLKKQ